jgi:mannitol-specific phosphotransferase system IIBC component
MSSKSRGVIVSIIAVMIVAIIVTIVLISAKKSTILDAAAGTQHVIQSDPTKADPANQESQTKPDLSLDLGACNAVTKSSVVSALGARVQTIGDAINRGYAKENDGIESQSCTFALSSADTQDDRYTTTVTVFSTSDSLTASKAAFANISKVNGIGDVAYYETIETSASPGTAAEHTYDFYIFSGSKLYTLAITQEADSDVFVSNSAEDALVTIAKSIAL